MESSHFEASAGSIYIEIPIMLSAESGESKHTDLNEQGLFLAYSVAKYLSSIESEGTALSELTFWGTHLPGTSEPIRKIDFNKDL